MIKYDRINQFYVYNLSTQKVHVAKDIDIDIDFLSLTSNKNLDNMAFWSKNNDIIFDNKNKKIYNNLLFNKTLLNKTARNKA